jgi:PAS domain S-box-containing protein
VKERANDNISKLVLQDRGVLLIVKQGNGSPVVLEPSIPKAPTRQVDLFRLLVESIRDYAIFVLDPDGRVLTWNPGAQAMKGYTREEIVGQHFSKFYLPEAIENGWPERELALAEKEGRFADEGWRLRKDGTSFWASVIITALRSADGEHTGFAKVTQDMTARRQSEEHVQALKPRIAPTAVSAGRIAKSDRTANYGTSKAFRAAIAHSRRGAPADRARAS